MFSPSSLFSKGNIINKVTWLLLFIIVLMYFIYHTFNGNRGLFAMLKLEKELNDKQEILMKLQLEKDNLENQTSLLKANNYDLDFIDEIARDYFALVDPEEEIIVIN